jgi:hypothetical protein
VLEQSTSLSRREHIPLDHLPTMRAMPSTYCMTVLGMDAGAT